MKGKPCLLYLFILLACLAGCRGEEQAAASFPVQVVLEEAPGVHAEEWITQPDGEERAVFTLQVSDGYTVTGSDWPDCTLEPNPAGKGLTMTLNQVRYSTVVTLQVEQSPATLLCHANGGQRIDGGDPLEAVAVPVTPSHQRLNTPTGTELFQRSGWTLFAWNTLADGNGQDIGLGSRVEPREDLVLYAQWSRWSEETLFSWRAEGGGAVITGYVGEEERVTVPESLGGLPVRAINAGAFAHATCRSVILPPGLLEVRPDAFSDAAVEELYLFDDLGTVSDYAFDRCDNLTTLHINAVEPPVYSGTYFDTFSDKYDRLLSLAEQRKLILFSGSSTRFGYDSAALDAAFPGYAVVNMGVFAYTNALPQLLLILQCAGEGDVLLHSPEFDAAKRQFCTTTALDASIFAMMESNYDNFARLNLREFTGVFTALNAYLSAKAGMPPRSYALSPSDFDEDGVPVKTKSYNKYGDYVLFRPNADSDSPVYGLPEDYTIISFPEELFIRPLNAVYQRFLDKGAAVLFTYAPRNKYALSEESTPEARAQLDQYFRDKLIVPVISSLEESLYAGSLLYGTDNHLSTEGVQLRTQQIIEQLAPYLEEGSAP